MKDLRVALGLLFSDKRHRGLVVLAMLATLAGAVMPSIPPLLMKRTIDDGVLAKNDAALVSNATLYVCAVLLELVLSLISQSALSTLGQRSMHSLRQRLFGHLQTLDLSYFEREPRGRILTRVTSDVEALSEMFTSGAVTMVADFVVALCIVGAMFMLNVRLTLITFLTVPPLIVLAEVFRRQAATAFRDIRARLAKLNAFASEHLAGIEVIQAFRAEQRVKKKFRQVGDELKASNKRAIRVDASLFAIVEAIGTIAVAAMIWFGARDLVSGALQLGVLVAFVQYVQRFFVPIRDLSSKFAIIQSGLAAAERVDQFLGEKRTIADGLEQRSTILPIALERVSFSYGDTPVLHDVDLRLPLGRKIALVGATGSGKTTLVKLLMRLVEPSSGGLTAGGLPLPAWKLEQLRQRMALVPQEPVIFEGTLRENLSMFDSSIPDSALLQAAASIGAAQTIQRLGGLDAPLKERGSNLSSGEAQLLAFTRALVRKPELLILDEATSSIDASTEALVTRGLGVLLEGRTALVIAHRLATLRMADEIIVLQAGRVKERGTHEELLRAQGVYAALYALQFSKAA